MGDLWDSSINKTKTNILSDFDRPSVMKINNGMLPLKERKIGQADAIMKIDRFVDMVLRSEKPAFRFKKKHHYEFKETFIGNKLREILPLTRIFDSYHLYSNNPAIFFRAFWLISSVYGSSLTKPMHRNIRPDMHRADVMNHLIDQIRFESKHTWYQRFAYDRKFETKEKAEALVGYTADILRYYSKTLVVRVDFGYLGGTSAPVTIDRVLDDFHDMLERRGSCGIFEHLVGYAWAFEQSDRKGFHVHSMFFFDGSKVRQDVSLGFAIGNLWKKDVTLGLGAFHNCNAQKEKYERCGIGMIHRDSEEECTNCMEFMQYIVKGGPFLERDNQFLRIRPQSRTFGTGQAPDLADKRRGRPAVPAPWLEGVGLQ